MSSTSTSELPLSTSYPSESSSHHSSADVNVTHSHHLSHASYHHDPTFHAHNIPIPPTVSPNTAISFMRAHHEGDHIHTNQNTNASITPIDYPSSPSHHSYTCTSPQEELPNIRSFSSPVAIVKNGFTEHRSYETQPSSHLMETQQEVIQVDTAQTGQHQYQHQPKANGHFQSNQRKARVVSVDVLSREEHLPAHLLNLSLHGNRGGGDSPDLNSHSTNISHLSTPIRQQSPALETTPEYSTYQRNHQTIHHPSPQPVQTHPSYPSQAYSVSAVSTPVTYKITRSVTTQDSLNTDYRRASQPIVLQSHEIHPHHSQHPVHDINNPPLSTTKLNPSLKHSHSVVNSLNDAYVAPPATSLKRHQSNASISGIRRTTFSASELANAIKDLLANQQTNAQNNNTQVPKKNPQHQRLHTHGDHATVSSTHETTFAHKQTEGQALVFDFMNPSLHFKAIDQNSYPLRAQQKNPSNITSSGPSPSPSPSPPSRSQSSAYPYTAYKPNQANQNAPSNQNTNTHDPFSHGNTNGYVHVYDNSDINNSVAYGSSNALLRSRSSVVISQVDSPPIQSVKAPDSPPTIQASMANHNSLIEERKETSPIDELTQDSVRSTPLSISTSKHFHGTTVEDDVLSPAASSRTHVHRQAAFRTPTEEDITTFVPSSSFKDLILKRKQESQHLASTNNHDPSSTTTASLGHPTRSSYDPGLFSSPPMSTSDSSPASHSSEGHKKTFSFSSRATNSQEKTDNEVAYSEVADADSSMVFPSNIVQQFEVLGPAGDGSTCVALLVENKQTQQKAVFKPRDGEAYEEQHKLLMSGSNSSRAEDEDDDIAYRKNFGTMKLLPPGSTSPSTTSSSSPSLDSAPTSSLLTTATIRTPIKPGVVYGDTSLKERAAYVMDHGGFAGVPKTVEAILWLKKKDAPPPYQYPSNSQTHNSKLMSVAASDESTPTHLAPSMPNLLLPPGRLLTTGRDSPQDSSQHSQHSGSNSPSHVQSLSSSPHQPPDILLGHTSNESPNLRYSPATHPGKDNSTDCATNDLSDARSGETLVPTYGSLQDYVDNEGNVEDMGSGSFNVEEVHKIGILDIRILNLDRHLGNILVHQDSSGYHLIPIDHGYILPSYHDLSEVHLEWTYWKQCQQPFSDRSRAYIESLDPLEDAAKLRELGIRDDALVSMLFSSLLLKRATADGLTLYHIARMVQRARDQQSNLEKIVAKVFQIIEEKSRTRVKPLQLKSSLNSEENINITSAQTSLTLQINDGENTSTTLIKSTSTQIIEVSSQSSTPTSQSLVSLPFASTANTQLSPQTSPSSTLQPNGHDALDSDGLDTDSNLSSSNLSSSNPTSSNQPEDLFSAYDTGFDIPFSELNEEDRLDAMINITVHVIDEEIKKYKKDNNIVTTPLAPILKHK